MRMAGEKLQLGRMGTFELRRADGSFLALTLRPLALGFHRRLRERGIVPPEPPSRIARDSAGRPLKDDRGHPLVTSDDRDPDYRAGIELYHQRVAVLAAVESLAAEAKLEFETRFPVGNVGWSSFADAIYDEFVSAGWSDGDLIRLCEEIGRLSHLFDRHLGEVRETFSNATPPHT